ncbi:MAG TPA: energy transducer TonB [Gemmatimonadaceae bacterium]|nr:energy transducer TonB [Gemmatimonadaceae bacterium]
MSALSSLDRTASLACALTLLAGGSTHAAAQTLGGQVVQLDTKKPLAGAAVALVNDSAMVVAQSAASPDGAFYLDAPKAGAYRLVLFVSGASFVSPSVQLDSGKTIERQFSVPDVPDTFSSTLFARDVTSEATPVPGSPKPQYPAGLAAEGIRSHVSTMFVVSEQGQPDLETFRVLSTTTNERFVDAIRAALQRTRFVPAQKDGAAVRQVVQYTYDFGLPGDPDRGDVVIRPVVAATAPAGDAKAPAGEAKAPVKTMFVIGADELSAREIEQMNLAEAMHRLRPRLYGAPRTATKTDQAEPPVYVNGVRAEGMASLRGITARDVEEVRYWKPEEAFMKFGLAVPYAVTVTLRPGRS